MPAKKRNGKMTMDKLAQMSQREFTGIRGEFKSVREEMHGGFKSVREEFDVVHENARILRNDMESGFQSILETLKLMREDMKELKIGVHTEFMELHTRVLRLEKKAGIK